MKITSLQQAERAAFMGAFRGLRSQGWKQSLLNKHCVFDGPDGRHCAVGWLIRDRKVAKDFNISGVGVLRAVERAFAEPLAEWLDKAPIYLKNDFFSFLSTLQGLHDSCPHPKDMEQGFTELAAERNWPIPD